MDLRELKIYNIAVEIADLCWPVYSEMDWQEKKVMGDQWIRSVDSVAANIAEANGRFHYLDRCRFYYNSRGSLSEAIHWTTTLFKREKIDKKIADILLGKMNDLGIKLNNAISATYKQKKGGEE
jgi:four helix bundle protein